MRLIDADALDMYECLRSYYGDAWRDAQKAIDDAPTVDAVEVVRCKDCVHCKHFNDVWYLPKRDELLCTRCIETYHTTENDYCSRGRKERR